MAALNVYQDGAIYCIELERAGSGERMEALLQEDAGGWLVTEITRTTPINQRLGSRLGRRKQWQTALAEALVFIENELIHREGLSK